MKLMKILLAVLVMAAMVTPVMAEDRLSLAGSMQVRAFAYDTDWSDFGGTDDDGEWNDQRLRIGGKLAVAEGVSVNFRFDVTESDENSSNAVAWGGSKQSAYQYSQRRADVQFDKAFLQIEKNGLTLQAGQLYFGGFGYTRQMLDVVGAGFIVKGNGFTLAHVKRVDENNGNDSFAKVNDGDVSLTVAKYDFKGDGFSLTPMIGYNADSNSTNYDLLGLGLAGKFDIGAAAVKFEVNYFDGETDAYKFTPRGLPSFTLANLEAFPGELAGTDVEGLQLMVDASTAASDNVRIGLQGWFAEGQDDAIQAVGMNRDANVVWDFADYHPEHFGYWGGDFVDEMFDIYDPAGINGGVIAGQLYADVKASDDLSFKFAGMYFQNEDDTLAEYDGYSLNAGLAYALAPNTTLTVHANYLKFDFDEALEYDVDAETKTLQAITGLVVKF